MIERTIAAVTNVVAASCCGRNEGAGQLSRSDNYQRNRAPLWGWHVYDVTRVVVISQGRPKTCAWEKIVTDLGHPVLPPVPP